MLRRGAAELLLTHRAAADAPGWLVVALRPYNPEGVSFVHRLALEPDRAGWTVDRKRRVRFDDAGRAPPLLHLPRRRRLPAGCRSRASREAVDCDVGMASAAALFRIEPESTRSRARPDATGARRGIAGRRVRLAMALRSRAELRRWHAAVRQAGDSRTSGCATGEAATWAQALDGHCRLETAHEPTRFLYDAAVRTLVLHAPGEDVYPGPYTYKRFWFRDAAFILHALLCLGLFDRARRVLDSYPGRQRRDGFFLSQEGEWDSNGEALWILERSCPLSGRWLEEPWHHAVERGARWIAGKRVPDHPTGRTATDAAHAGLAAGGVLRRAPGPQRLLLLGRLLGCGRACARRRACSSTWAGRPTARALRQEADDLLAAIDRSVARAVERLGRRRSPPRPTGASTPGRSARSPRPTRSRLWAPGRPADARHDRLPGRRLPGRRRLLPGRHPLRHQPLPDPPPRPGAAARRRSGAARPGARA